jgi:hypothetical protein
MWLRFAIATRKCPLTNPKLATIEQFDSRLAVAIVLSSSLAIIVLKSLHITLIDIPEPLPLPLPLPHSTKSFIAPPPFFAYISQQHQSMSVVRRFLSTFTPSPVTMEAAKQKAQSLIDENAVMLFSKSYCPYCRASKKTLESVGAKYQVRWEQSLGPPTPATHK